MLRLLFILLALVAITYGLRLPSVPKLDDRIIGGIDASITKFPYQVSVRVKSGTSFAHNCGGSIYNKRVIVTAAHCLLGQSPTNLRIIAGVSSLNAIAGLLEIERLIVNSRYSVSTIDSDVGLIILAKQLEYSANIQPIPLAENNPSAGRDAIVTGWGTTKEGGLISDVLQEVTVQIVDNASCSKSYGTSPITENMICAGVEKGGKDACQGDSGGPMVVDGELVGIVSWGRGCAHAEFPGIYASVPSLHSWIEENAAPYS